MPQEIDRRLASGMLANRLPSTRILAELAGAWTSGSLGSRASDEPGGSAAAVRADVEPGLGDKPVCLFGGGYSLASQQTRAVTGLYGLELFAPKEGEYHLMMPISAQPESAQDFPRQVQRMMPPSLLRQYASLSVAIGKAAEAREGALDPADDSGTMRDRIRRKMAAAQRNLLVEATAVRAGYFPADRRLLILAKPLVPTRASPPVRVTDANPEVLRLLAIMYYSSDGCRKQVAELIGHPLPESLAHPEEMVIKVAGFKNGEETGASWDIGYRDANGRYHRERMFSAPIPSSYTTPSGGALLLCPPALRASYLNAPGTRG